MERLEPTAGPSAVASLGRESELEVLRRFLSNDGGGAALCLVGEPGIGKTTLWEAGRAMAEDNGFTVLSARASEAETALSFAALADVVDGIGDDILSTLPVPQLRALEVALRRASPLAQAPEPYAISAGFYGALKALADRQPLLVAIDDVQWLDEASAGAVLFAARRGAGPRARFLLSRRAGRPSELERVLGAAGLEQLDVGSLSFGAIGRIMAERLGATPPRRVLHQVYDASQGNPLFALEMGRMLKEAGPVEPGAELPVPDLVEDIFGPRVNALRPDVRRVLLAVGLSSGLSRPEIEKFVDPLSLQDAIASGLVVVDKSLVRPAHPMLAAAARTHSTARQRHELHLDMASALSDPTLRARHLAIATLAPDEALAAALGRAAQGALDRGALHEAEELAAHALRLTPLGADARTERLLALARCHGAAGDLAGSAKLLGEHLDEIPAGPQRAMAHLLLGEAASIADEEAHLQVALTEAAGDAALTAVVTARRAVLLVINLVEKVDEAEDLLRTVLASARRAGAVVDQRIVVALAWTAVLRGRPLDDLSDLAVPAFAVPNLYEGAIERPAAVRLAFRGQVNEAEAQFEELLGLANYRGDARAALVIEIQRCELALRAGDVDRAARLLDDVAQWSPLEEMATVRARLYAVIGAVSGLPGDAEHWASRVLGPGVGAAPGWDRLETFRARGLAALFAGDTVRAVTYLRAVWDHSRREHVDDPGAFPAAPDLVEAFLAAGDVPAAVGVAERLRRLATEQDHPWGLASASRCDALVQLAQGADATEGLMDAAEAYEGLGLNFDRARCLLLLGRAQRRAKKRAAARLALEKAAAVFEGLGCTGWAEQARSELARVSGRRSPGDDELTPTERRVAELASQGLANKQIAGQLFISVYTVEAHLSHAYAKLGVRSRSQLSHRMGTTPA